MVLGFTTPQMAYTRLDDSEKSYVSLTDVGMKPGRPLIAISESGLYKLILASRKPEAKPFQDWVTKVVLPALRTDGMYVVKEEMTVQDLTSI